MKKALRLISCEPFRIVFGAVALLFALFLDHPGAEIAALIGMIGVGFPIFGDAALGILRRDLLDEKLLMTLASVGAFLLGEYTEGIAVLLFFVVGEYFEHRAVRASRRSISALMDICPDRAKVLCEGREEILDADEVEIGDVIVISPGERIPVDCRVLSGSASVSLSAITGEPLPISASEGVFLPSGSLCLDGRLTAECEAIAERSSAARILELVEVAQENKSREESFITKFSRIYTPTVVLLAAFIGGLLPLFIHLAVGGSIGALGLLYRTWVHRALIFLVVSCPCALVISVPLSFFGGIGGAASVGILFKGGNRFHAIARAKTVCFDKTGTLTSGECRILSLLTFGDLSREELLSLAASVESASSHPIARAIVAEAEGELLSPEDLTEYAGRGISARVGSRSVAVGNASLAEALGYGAPPDSYPGATLGWVDGRLAGAITFFDSPRPESAPAVSALRRLGVSRIVMLTGDSAENARAVADEIGIDEVYAGLLPEDKYAAVERLSREGASPILFVGDGINDAPVLTRADVGVAMGGIGSDAAIEASDAVITSDSPLRLADAIRLARKTIAIAKENIIFAITVKLAILLLSALGIVESMWLAVFADVGVAVLAILNAIRAVRRPRLLDPKER